jgi:two-component system cell cycle response regulator
MSSDSKKVRDSKSPSDAGVRHTATKTELLTSPDSAAQDLISKASQVDPALIVIQGEMLGRVFRLKPGRSVIGRHPSCDVQVQQRTVSGFHAEIQRNGAVCMLEDLKSSNGTVLNKEKIASATLLRAGDLLRIGSSVFRYVDSNLEADFSENLHQKVTRDALTGVFNKAYLLQALQSSLEIAKTGYKLSMVIFDLDYFKKINDTYGHIAGDFVLKECCRILVDSVLRAEDILGRFGGEEFIVVLPDSELPVAVQVAERIRKTIESHVFDFQGTRIPVTTSLGVMEWQAQFSSVDAFIEATDQLMYTSKRGGRNRVTSPA